MPRKTLTATQKLAQAMLATGMLVLWWAMSVGAMMMDRTQNSLLVAGVTFGSFLTLFVTVIVANRCARFFDEE